jgi:DNA-binding LacI/PurR family transcriptional regulator
MGKRSNKKRVTSYDVAKVAGVSQSAVSRAFRPGLSVSAKTKDKVMKAAKKLGYKPNAIARMLITQRSGMVAVIISSMANLVYPELLSRLTAHLSERGVKVLLFTLDAAEQLEGLLEQIWTYQVDGVIALTAHFDFSDIAQFEEHDIPFVLYNRRLVNHGVNSVSVDHEHGIMQLVDLLIETGNKDFLVCLVRRSRMLPMFVVKSH